MARPARSPGRVPLSVKLWGGVVLANLLGLGVAVRVAGLVRGQAVDPGSETWLMALYYGAMLVVAAVDALWLDEILFRGAFRITHIQGRAEQLRRRGTAKRAPGPSPGRRAADDADDDVGQLAATFQQSTVSFPFSLLIFGLLTGLLFNAANQNFDRYYRDVGRHVATLRAEGDDDDDRRRREEAVVALSLHGRVEALNALADALEHPDEQTASFAAWALGRHWQGPHARHLVQPLVGAYRQRGRPVLRREALIALSRLQHRSFAGAVQAALEAELEGDEVDLRLLWGLGYLQHTSSFPVLEKALAHRDVEVAAVAAWALAQHRDQVGGDEAVTILEGRLPSAPFPVKCAIVHGLMVLGDEASNFALLHAWDAMPPEQRLDVCAALVVPVRPDGLDDEQKLITTETYAMKTLEAMGRMRATSPAVRARVEPWLERQIASDDSSLKTREAAASLLAGIREARDDVAAIDPRPAG